MGLGRKGERVANTPMRTLPPSRGGRTVGDQPASTFWENPHTSQMWVKPSRPRKASRTRYSGANTTRARRASTRPLCRGMPNFSEKSLCMRAMGRRVHSSIAAPPFLSVPIVPGKGKNVKARPQSGPNSRRSFSRAFFSMREM